MLKCFVSVLIIIAFLGMTGCEKEDPKTLVQESGGIIPPLPGGDDPDPGNNPGGVVPIEDSKEYLEATAKRFLNLFNPSDQKEIISLTRYFSEKYGDLSIPREWITAIESREVSYSPARFMKNLGLGLASCNPMMVTRAAVEVNYNFNFPMFSGIYVAGSKNWEKVGESADIVFEFDSAYGERCQLKIKASSTISNFPILSDDDYMDENGQIIDEIVRYNLAIPKIVTFSLSQGGKVLVNGSIESNFDIPGHALDITTDVTLANLRINEKISATDSRINASSTFYVDGSRGINTTVALNGWHLCDYDYFVSAYTQNFDILAILNSGTAHIDVMDSIQIDGEVVSFSSNLIDALNIGHICSYDGYDRNTAGRIVQQNASIINRNIPITLRYNNTSSTQANIKCIVDEYNEKVPEGGYWEYYLLPVICFSDGTQYEFFEYFSSGFGSVPTLFDSVIASYRRAWNR